MNHTQSTEDNYLHAQFPAIAIGGPPQSGKSVLTYSLTQALRDASVDHYVLRACPDGEGDWSNESALHVVQVVRDKDKFTDHFVENVCRVLTYRRLPLLVDLGGKPSPENDQILTHCTHMILLARNEPCLAVWRQMAQKHNLPILAELTSTLSAPASIHATQPHLQAQIYGLQRGALVTGLVMSSLTEVVSNVMAEAQEKLRQSHATAAPDYQFVDLDQVRRQLQLPGREWHPAELPAALACTPSTRPIALYGRNTNWTYSAFFAHISSAQSMLFDARLGWAAPTVPQLVAEPQPSAIQWRYECQNGATVLHIDIPTGYLVYEAAHAIQLLRITTDGLII
ncbi:MAG: hypothetical protein KDK05_28485, partial [Candidatus Competibacteraceae bacterium]|nr:hypothetical protein [Candidatus Competibacteraceae bacterium]